MLVFHASKYYGKIKRIKLIIHQINFLDYYFVNVHVGYSCLEPLRKLKSHPKLPYIFMFETLTKNKKRFKITIHVNFHDTLSTNIIHVTNY